MLSDELALDKTPKKKAIILLFTYFACLLTSQIIRAVSGNSFWPEWAYAFYLLCTYLIIALLIYVERDHLSDFNIDGLTLAIYLIFGSLFRLLHVADMALLCFSGMAFIAIALWLSLALRKSKVRVGWNLKASWWIFVGILITEGLQAPVITFYSAFGVINHSLAFSVETLRLFGTFFLDQLANVAVEEELIFRGFLCGYLHNLGWRVRTILLFQAVLFTLFHFAVIANNPWFFWPHLFGVSLVWGFIAWKSRSVAPSLISHALGNAISALLGLVS